MSEASYRAIFDAAEDAIFVHRHRNRRRSWMPIPKPVLRLATVARSSGDSIVGTLGSGEHPYTQQDAMELIARAAAGEQLRIEWHGKSKDGTLALA